MNHKIESLSQPVQTLSQNAKVLFATTLIGVIGIVGLVLAAPGDALLPARSLTTGEISTPPEIRILPASILRTKGIDLNDESLAGSSVWYGLVCNSLDCEFRPVNLAIDGQRVSFTPDERTHKAKGEFTIALISGVVDAPKSAIPTWFTLRTPRNPKDVDNGTLGVTVSTSTNGDYRIIPRLNQKAGNKWLSLYLESTHQRQRLGQISFESLNAGLKTRDILIWAGDMDGDGKIDLITRVRDSSSERGLHLWLSSHAVDGDMVGIAASLDNWSDVEEAEGC
jgi:hypothetical protein